MADILRSYEQQFGILCADITSNISKATGMEDKSSLISLIENLFQEANEIIEQMDLEIRDINSAIKRTPQEKDKYLNIIRSYKQELAKLEGVFQKQVKSKRGHVEIQLNDNDDDEDEEVNDLRQENRASINKMNSNLDKGYRIVLETEETGNNILSDLFGQREQLKRSRDRLRQANINLGKSSRIVGDMARKLIQNKIILVGLVLFVLLAVIFIVYYKMT